MDARKTNKSPPYPYLLVALFVIMWSVEVAGGVNLYVEEACSVTRYRDLCVKSLASFSNEARRSPSKWARAGVSVTIGEMKELLRYLVNVKRYGRGTGRTRVAVSDCVEVIQDALDNLHLSLNVLRKLNRGEFEGQMSDVLTWLSTTLTDEDTCKQGLDEGRPWPRGRRGRGITRSVERRVITASYMTSNALALANKLSTSGFA